jgi:hypothetical protein
MAEAQEYGKKLLKIITKKEFTPDIALDKMSVSL